MNDNKHQAVIDFLCNCPQIRDNPLYFNFINAKDENKQIITQANDIATHRPYIDGSVKKRYTFTLIDFKSLSYNPIVKNIQVNSSSGSSEPEPAFINENVEEILDTQAIIDWIREQADINNYPNFGEDCYIDDMRVTSDIPNLNGIDTRTNPVLAQYSFTIQIDYIDSSKKLWRNS